MSLINQMLRDLEQRHAHMGGSSATVKVSTATGSAAYRPSRVRPVFRLLAAGGFVLVYVSGIYEKYGQLLALPKNNAAEAGAVIQQPEPISTPQPSPAQSQNPEQGSAVNQANNQVIEQNTQPVPEADAAAKPATNLKSARQFKLALEHERVLTLYFQAKTSPSLESSRNYLETILQIDPRYLPARTLMLQILLKSHVKGLELTEFVDKSLLLFPDNPTFLKTRAHLYIEQKDYAAAVNLLEQADPSRISDSAYLALLAGCYAQLQFYPQASEVYNRLTKIQPEKAENWLGLAIAQDKLNQSDSAVAAYQQALDKNTLHEEVVAYIKQRLHDLNPDVN
ncbi:MAG: tetratricopeptide repeat protein [Methylomonas sp.]